MHNKFNSQLYTDLDISINDFMNNKLYKVHQMLYLTALEKCISEKNLSKETNNFVEDIVSKNYYDPSYVIVISRTYPFSKERISLSEWWPKYKFDLKAVDMPYEYDINYKDYINGTYKMTSKFFDGLRSVKFNTLNSHFEGRTNK